MRIITSPVELWPGTVTLPRWLNFEQAAAWEDAIAAVAEKKAEITRIEASADPKIAPIMLPAILSIVQTWNLGGEFPCPPGMDSFPSTPRMDSARLLAWLIGAVDELYSDATDLPLASPLPPTPG
jgi:hypothetical protein